MIDQRKRIFAVNLWIFDLVLTTASFFLAYRVRLLFALEGHVLMPVRVYLWLLAIILPTWAFLLPVFRVYSEPTLAPLSQIKRLSKGILGAWFVVAAMVSFVKPDASNRIILMVTLAINYILLVTYRVVLMKVTKRGALDVRHVAVIGSGPSAHEFARTIEGHHFWGLQLTGVFRKEEVRGLLKDGGVDELILVVDRESLDQFTDTFLLCEELGVTARVVLNFFPHSIARMELHEFDGFPLLSFSTTPTNEALMFVRRILDVVLAGLMLLVTGPFVMLPTAILIKLTSPGPVLFLQRRCGLNGRQFMMYKFRSMVDNAEQLRVEVEGLNEMDGPVFKSSRDPRITTVGKIIRRFSFDELPQVFNVLRGDMSLVGPRPPLPAEVARYERWQRRRLSMRPGMTCLWQISGRNEVSFEDWMKLDLTYIDNWSLLLDLKILLKTVPVVLLGRGAK
ncbi:MAG TPA: sugar transferase [Terriglobia bacterium]|jgi:exopolysaccharide biosynthesis polyprenyl glycosylphosphotransferase